MSEEKKTIFESKVAQRAFEYMEAKADSTLEKSLGAVIEQTKLEPQLVMQAKCELQQAHFGQCQNAIVTASQIDAAQKQINNQAPTRGGKKRK